MINESQHKSIYFFQKIMPNEDYIDLCNNTMYDSVKGQVDARLKAFITSISTKFTCLVRVI